jgi:hypothetical protein
MQRDKVRLFCAFDLVSQDLWRWGSCLERNWLMLAFSPRFSARPLSRLLFCFEVDGRKCETVVLKRAKNEVNLRAWPVPNRISAVYLKADTGEETYEYSGAPAPGIKKVSHWPLLSSSDALEYWILNEIVSTYRLHEPEEGYEIRGTWLASEKKVDDMIKQNATVWCV